MHPTFLPYGHQIIEESDIQAVIAALKSGWLTTGPAVSNFEDDLCRYTGAKYGVAVSSGTAALHAAMAALDIGPGDEVIVPPITFVATANCVLYQGATPVFADVDEHTLLIDPAAVEAAITKKTKAIIAVDYAGQPCVWDKLQQIAQKNNLPLIADSCHALGANYKGQMTGTLADINIFSFHPVKHITTAEGGMALTNDGTLAERMRVFKRHGITTTPSQRERSGLWFYEMQMLGYNYRISDLQCALGSAQLKRLPQWLDTRISLAQCYDSIFANNSKVQPLKKRPEVRHSYHLYVVQVPNRDKCFAALRSAGIGANVHYIPVYLHPYYQQLGYKQGLCPNAENVYKKILTLPLWVGMTNADVRRVANIVLEVCDV